LHSNGCDAKTVFVVKAFRVEKFQQIGNLQVTAVYKKGRKLDRANYRPVSLTRCFFLQNVRISYPDMRYET